MQSRFSKPPATPATLFPCTDMYRSRVAGRATGWGLPDAPQGEPLRDQRPTDFEGVSVEEILERETRQALGR